MIWRTGDGAEAVTLFQKSLALRREVGDRVGEATSMFNLGTAHVARGEYRQAHECLVEVLETCRALGYRSGEALALNVFSDLCWRLGEAEKSEAQVRETLKIFRDW
jgi:tetratricopeptide (TPR) repeat protein